MLELINTAPVGDILLIDISHRFSDGGESTLGEMFSID
jgi:hypothetical protein